MAGAANFYSAAASRAVVSKCTLSGSLDATASAGVSNSASVTVNVPAGNSGDISLENFVDVGTIGSIRYNKASAGLTTFTDPTVVTFTNGQSLIIQVNSNNAGESRTFTLRDVTTGQVIGTYTHTGA